ncbi:uncharacterized protein [Periplaneta americana]|uniref:uncharacterized protein n=1 Tax=Periplaneta americana TaxID=6978 RepID=UPI0037E94A6C
MDKKLLIVAFISAVACLSWVSASKRTFTVVPLRIGDVRMNKDLVDFRKLKILKQSKGSVVKGTLEIKVDFDNGTICAVQAYQNAGGGKFVKGPASIPPKNCCEFIESDNVFWPSMKKANFPEKCPIKKGVYEIKGYDINEANFPDDIPPPNEWMLELNMTSADGKEYLTGKGYAEIKRQPLKL